MRDYNTLTHGLELLRGAVIQDRFSHLDVFLNGVDAPEALVASNFSMQAGKPVCFRSRHGCQWWTDGIRYNPDGPSEEIFTETIHTVRYTDSHGFPHREGGPAVRHYHRGYYVEEWLIHPGMLHRTDGPAKIELSEHNPVVMTWGEFAQEDGFRYCGMSHFSFEKDTKVRYYDHRAMVWMVHGRPKHGKNGYTTIRDENVAIVTEITPSLITKVWTIIGTREYLWENEDGELSRTDGPAKIRMHGIAQNEMGGQKGKMEFVDSSWTWYHNGRSIDHSDIDEWLEKHKIKLVKSPPVEKSAFENPDDEFCFMTDLLTDYEPRLPF